MAVNRQPTPAHVVCCVQTLMDVHNYVCTWSENIIVDLDSTRLYHIRYRRNNSQTLTKKPTIGSDIQSRPQFGPVIIHSHLDAVDSLYSSRCLRKVYTNRTSSYLPSLATAMRRV